MYLEEVQATRIISDDYAGSIDIIALLSRVLNKNIFTFQKYGTSENHYYEIVQHKIQTITKKNNSYIKIEHIK